MERISASELVNSLTGFEEIAIEKHMGIDPYADGGAKPVKVLRALAFVQEVRDGKPAGEARQVAMGLTLQEVSARFEEEIEEIDPEIPDTEQGKDSDSNA